MKIHGSTENWMLKVGMRVFCHKLDCWVEIIAEGRERGQKKVRYAPPSNDVPGEMTTTVNDSDLAY